MRASQCFTDIPQMWPRIPSLLVHPVQGRTLEWSRCWKISTTSSQLLPASKSRDRLNMMDMKGNFGFSHLLMSIISSYNRHIISDYCLASRLHRAQGFQLLDDLSVARGNLRLPKNIFEVQLTSITMVNCQLSKSLCFTDVQFNEKKWGACCRGLKLDFPHVETEQAMVTMRSGV